MMFGFARRMAPAAACAAVLAGLAAPTIASADTHWLVSGVFDDGGTLSGYFDINVDGWLDGYDLTTAAGTIEGGFDYTPLTSYFANGTFFVDAEPGYFNDLHLEFADPISAPVADNPIVSDGGASYECVQSWSCYVPNGGVTRYLTGGSATAGSSIVADLRDEPINIPEPGMWLLMLTGFGGAGAMLRQARRKVRLAAA
jgi:hypothetical protein